MISQITNVLLMPKIFELAKSVSEEAAENLKKVMLDSLPREDSRIFVSEKEGEVNGFIFATIEEIEAEPAIYIQYCVVRPEENERNICNELLTRIRRWGSEKNIGFMYFATRRNAEAFKRKYKFTYHTTWLKRSVSNGESVPE